MGYISVDVDINTDDVIDQLSDRDIMEEFMKRGLCVKITTDPIEKRQTLTEVSDFLRKNEHIALAARIDELMMELEL